MAEWCRDRGVELAPHGKTHMAPQLLARQFAAGATAVTLATISQVRTFRAFGVDRVVLANELVDDAGLRWLAAELDAHPDFDLVCWVDSVRGVESMSATLAGRGRPTSGRRLRRGRACPAGAPGAEPPPRSMRWRAPRRLPSDCAWSASRVTRPPPGTT